MAHPLLGVQEIQQAPDSYLASIGTVFAVFGENTQDSGNISYGVSVLGERYFVKTAGLPDDPVSFLRHPDRVRLLRNAVRLRQSCSHPALPALHQVVESPAGPMLVYQWLEGELIGARREKRDDPSSAFQRFRRLP